MPKGDRVIDLLIAVRPKKRCWPSQSVGNHRVKPSETFLMYMPHYLGHRTTLKAIQRIVNATMQTPAIAAAPHASISAPDRRGGLYDTPINVVEKEQRLRHGMWKSSQRKPCHLNREAVGPLLRAEDNENGGARSFRTMNEIDRVF